VRELENRVKRAAIMADGKLVTAQDLDLGTPGGVQEDLPLNLKAAREQTDRQVIRHALTRSEGNISSTARLLGSVARRSTICSNSMICRARVTPR
jgi:two-component system NtrC family response regulator